jgi:voltage-gated potassium channel Kch
MMTRSDGLVRSAVAGLKRIGLRDLDHKHAEAEADSEEERKRRILLLGFYRAASSFLSELELRHAALLDQVCVVDFNPVVFHELKSRNVKVLYGDIAHADTLSHAGVAEAEIVISSVPDSLLKGTTNEKLVRYVRAINSTTKIVATADVFSQVDQLYAAGADYVTVARLAEANELIEVVTAAEDGLLDELREKIDPRLRERREVLP